MRNPDKEPSQWIAVARHETDLVALEQNPRWLSLEGDPARRIWTDDYSNLLSVFNR